MTPANDETAAAETSRRALRRIRLSAAALSALLVAGIAGLMILSAGKGEDITGIVAPAVLIALLAGIVATVAAALQNRI